MNENEFPETLTEAVTYFADADRAFEFMVALRWPDGKVVCQHCKSNAISFLKTRKIWKCMGCHKQFSAKVGTIFEDSPIGYAKWFPAMWMIFNAKNGISSCELARSLGVTQKTAWFMLHRIRLCMNNGSIMKMGGTVEVDETFIGGKARNMHKAVKERRNIKTGGESMTPVMGLLERGTREACSKVSTKVLKGRSSAELKGHVRQYVLKGSEVMTDAFRSYSGLCDEYTHQVIDHAVAYANGTVHTNGLENFWSLLKRSIKGTYVSVEPFHLFRYLDEQAFRFNERKNSGGDKGRFLEGVKGIIGRGIKYVDLIGKGGDDLHPAGTW
jgi:transposase-like protein